MFSTEVQTKVRLSLLLLLLSLAALAVSLAVRPGPLDGEVTYDASAAPAAQPAPTLELEMTAYTSEAVQTDASPTLTASGTRTGPGTAAVSRDLLERLPYGSRIRVVSTSGEGCGGWPPEAPLRVEDTMNVRIRNHLDIWVASTEQALSWGRCQARVSVITTPASE